MNGAVGGRVVVEWFKVLGIGY